MPRLRCHRGVGHGRRDGAQAFDPAQGLGQGEKFQRLDKMACRFRTALQLQADQRAEPVLLALGQ